MNGSTDGHEVDPLWWSTRPHPKAAPIPKDEVSLENDPGPWVNTGNYTTDDLGHTWWEERYEGPNMMVAPFYTNGETRWWRT